MLTGSGSTRKKLPASQAIGLFGLALACAGATAAPLGCLIEPSQVVEVGSHVIGVLERVDAERGDFVKKGQVLAQIQAEVERAGVSVAELKSQNQAELRSAAAAQDFAKRKQDRSESLYKSNYIALQAQDEAITEAALAELKLLQAREQKKLAGQELILARAQLSQRTIRSPISGLVVERYLSQGERVEEKPVVKVATLDPLRVEVIVPAAEFNKVKPGMTATVTPDLPNVGERTAKVTLVDRIVDAASNTFRVRLEMANPNSELPAGLRCKVTLATDNAAPTNAKPKAVAPAMAANMPAAPVASVAKPVKPIMPVVVPGQAPAMPAAKPAKAVVATGLTNEPQAK